MEFLGRAVELAVVKRRLDRAAEGQGGFILVHGEAGVGKTRFLRRAAEIAGGRKAAVASGRWYESPQVPGYVGFLEAFWQLLNVAGGDLGRTLDRTDPHVRELSRLGPDIAAALGLEQATAVVEDEDQYGLWRGVVALLEAFCENGPVVVTLDDIRWADQGSLELLSFISKSVDDLPLVVIAAYREGSVRPEHPLWELTALQGAHLEDIELSGLGREHIRVLMSEAVGQPVDESMAKKVWESTRGNPLFVEEMGRQLSSNHDRAKRLRPALIDELLSKDLPKSVRTLMAQRLDGLSPETQYLLQLAACVGRSFDVLLIDEIADVDGPALAAIIEEGIQTAVITETEPGQFAFTHPLMREASYGSISAANRIALHERVASALEHHYGETAPRHAREIANHLISAGGLADPARTLRYCTMGARQARALSSPEEVHKLAHAALGALERMSIQAPRLMASLLLEEAYADTLLGRPDEAISLYREALRIYRELDDADGKVDCNRWIATTLARYGRWDEAPIVTTDALAEAEEVRSHAYLALVGVHALAAMVNGRLEEAGIWSDKLLELSFDEETKAVAHHAAAAHNSFGVGDPKTALHHFEASRANFLSIARDGTAAQVAADQAVAVYLLGHVAESLKAREDAKELAERTNRITAVAELCAYEVVLETHRGNWPSARAAADRWRTLSSEMGGSTIYGQFAEHALALQRLWREGPSLDAEALGSKRPLRNEPLQAFLLAEQGSSEAAQHLFRTIKEMVPYDGRGFFWLSAALPLAATQLSLRDKNVVQWLPGLQRYSGCAFDWFHVDIEIGRIHALLEDWERAEESLQRAIAKCEADGLQTFLGVAQYHHGVMLLESKRRGNRQLGITEIERAGVIFSEVGMDHLAKKAGDLLPNTRTDAGVTRNPANLTAREWEILNRLAEGRTNLEISESLVISRRTVEFHLQNIYGKIAVNSRSAAIAWLAKQSAVEATAPDRPATSNP